MKLIASKKKKGLECCAHGCKKKPNSRLGGLCQMHYRRKCKLRDPVADRYYNFKYNALGRHKDFTITLCEFRSFCERTGYILDKGMRGKNATIDRRCNVHGYHIWNIQIMILSENVKKYWGYDRPKQMGIPITYDGFKNYVWNG